MYIVHANHVPLFYAPNYFPRKFRYKKEAIKCAQDVVKLGASLARVECPNGVELDFRPANKVEKK